MSHRCVFLLYDVILAVERYDEAGVPAAGHEGPVLIQAPSNSVPTVLSWH